MGDAWMPGARRVRAAADGGQMKGGAPRVVWLTLGADPRRISARSAAERLSQLGRPPHLVWNPVTGEIVQLIPVVRAACSMTALTEADAELATQAADGYAAGPLAVPPSGGAADVHAEGRLCVQVGVVGCGGRPFTAGPLDGAEQLVRWLDSWGISRIWPAGRPPAIAASQPAARSRRLWARGGHFGVSQVPCCTACGPGAIDVARLTGEVSAAVPRQRGNGAVPRPGHAGPAAVGEVDGVLDGELARVG